MPPFHPISLFVRVVDLFTYIVAHWADFLGLRKNL